MSYAMKIARCVGPDFALYSGNDDITVPILSIGGSGVISVYANVMPAMCRQIVADWLDGNHARALENHLRYLQLMNDLFLEVNPIPVKAAMNMMGLDVGPMRLPLCEMGRPTPPHSAGRWRRRDCCEDHFDRPGQNGDADPGDRCGRRG